MLRRVEMLPLAAGPEGRKPLRQLRFRWDVQRQFLLESVALCLLGGTAGIVLGAGAAAGFAAMLGWPVTISMEAVLAAVTVSVVVGVFFGYYPARRAAGLSPIDALRYD